MRLTSDKAALDDWSGRDSDSLDHSDPIMNFKCDISEDLYRYERPRHGNEQESICGFSFHVRDCVLCRKKGGSWSECWVPMNQHHKLLTACIFASRQYENHMAIAASNLCTTFRFAATYDRKLLDAAPRSCVRWKMTWSRDRLLGINH